MTVTLKPNRLEQFSDLVHLIYAASAEPSRWPDAVAAVAQSMQAQRTLLFTPFVGPAHGGLLFPWQIEEKHLALWGSKYIDHDVWAQNAQRKGVGKRGCADGRRVDARGRIPRLCVLPRVFEPDRHRPLVCGRRLWRLARPAGDLLACCLPIVLASRFWPAATGCTMTRRAASMAVRATGAGADASRLEHWLDELAALPESQRPGFGEVFRLHRNQVGAHYSAQCCPLAPENPLLLGEGAHHIVFVTDPRQVDLPAQADLQGQLGLTPAECRVTHGLAQGSSYKEVAPTLGIGEETVRSHVKAIYAKTRTHNKAGLTRLVLSLARAAV